MTEITDTTPKGPENAPERPIEAPEAPPTMAADETADTPTEAPEAVQATPKRKAKGGRPKKARGAATTSDKADARWTVRGVPKNVRAIAGKSAQARGMTVGDWVAEAIVAYGKSAGKGETADGGASVPATAADAPPDIRAMQDMLETFANRLDRIEQKQESPIGRWLKGLGKGNGKDTEAA